MESYIKGAEVISLFCRMNMNRKCDLPIRSSEMGLLIFLVRSKEPPTPLEVARFFRISKPMVTSMTRVLERNEYLIKKPSQIDGRSFTICPTEKARLLVEQTYEEYLRTIGLLQDKLGVSDYETLIALLERANSILLEEQ